MISSTHVAIMNPLQQGLKPSYEDVDWSDSENVAIMNPLQQGLKPWMELT